MEILNFVVPFILTLLMAANNFDNKYVKLACFITIGITISYSIYLWYSTKQNKEHATDQTNYISVALSSIDPTDTANLQPASVNQMTSNSSQSQNIIPSPTTIDQAYTQPVSTEVNGIFDNIDIWSTTKAQVMSGLPAGADDHRLTSCMASVLSGEHVLPFCHTVDALRVYRPGKVSSSGK
jgi:hypothetical protein